jgi:hypothetical protein
MHFHALSLYHWTVLNDRYCIFDIALSSIGDFFIIVNHALNYDYEKHLRIHESRVDIIIGHALFTIIIIVLDPTTISHLELKNRFSLSLLARRLSFVLNKLQKGTVFDSANVEVFCE